MKAKTRWVLRMLFVLACLLVVGCDDDKQKKEEGKKDETPKEEERKPGFGDTKVGPDESAHVFYRCAKENKCSKVQLIQVLHLVKKGTPEKTAIPHNQGMIDPGGTPLGYQLPAEADDKNGYVVDKSKSTMTTNDPYYAGSTPGTPTTPAELEDKPGNTKPGYKSIYEVCAFCSEKKGDADFGKYFDCFTWELDGDSKTASKTNPQPADKPTKEFKDAVDKWNINHGFTMPK
jgi:hypothetical protein